MVERRELGGWLQGPGGSSSDEGGSGSSSAFPGERLGRPAQGSGSIGRPGRRLAALAIDWALALVIGSGLMRPLDWGSFAPLAALLVMNTVLVGTAGFTFGHRLLGLRVERREGGQPGLTRAFARAVLLCLVVPAVVWDSDQRGLHDKAVDTVLVRL